MTIYFNFVKRVGAQSNGPQCGRYQCTACACFKSCCKAHATQAVSSYCLHCSTADLSLPRVGDMMLVRGKVTPHRYCRWKGVFGQVEGSSAGLTASFATDPDFHVGLCPSTEVSRLLTHLCPYHREKKQPCPTPMKRPLTALLLWDAAVAFWVPLLALVAGQISRIFYHILIAYLIPNINAKNDSIVHHLCKIFSIVRHCQRSYILYNWCKLQITSYIFI